LSDTAVRKAWRGKRGRWSLRLSGSDGRALGSSCKHNCGVHVSLTVRDSLFTRAIRPRRVCLSCQLLAGHMAKKCIDMYVYLVGRASKLLLLSATTATAFPRSKLIFTVTDCDKNLPFVLSKIRGRVVSRKTRRFTFAF